MTLSFQLKALRARVYRAPISTPVTTSFGVMRDRPMVLVEVEDTDGVRGFGEVWCNYPHVGAEHRARLIDSVLGRNRALSHSALNSVDPQFDAAFTEGPI